MKSYQIFGIGNALVDLEYQITEAELNTLGVDKGHMTLIEEDRHHELIGKLSAREALRGGGGSAANTVIATAQLGCDAWYSCKVANDDAGHFYMQAMDKAGVDTNLDSTHLEEGHTGKCIVLITPDAERSMSTYLGITQRLSTRELNREALSRSDMLYIEGYIVTEPDARNAAIEARKTAEAAGVQTSLTLSDANMVTYFRDGLLEMIGGGVDLLFCNEEEAMLMSRAHTLHDCTEWLKQHSRRFALTRGARGAVLYDGESLIEIPAVKVEPIDTNGAGDLYAGTFLYGLSEGLAMPRCGELASATTAALIRHHGARLPTEILKTVHDRVLNV